MKHYISLIVLCICMATTQAQTKQDSITKLEEVLVKGRKKTPKERGEFKRHAQSTEAMTLEDINRNNPAFIEQSLGSMAGVQVDKRTQLGGQRIVIRGYGNDQKFNNWGIKVYYNMFPLTTADGTTTLDDVDFSNVNNIEVVKGPAATMYGAGVGGVARFYLKANDYKGITFSQNTAVGSFGLFQSNSRMDYNTDKMASFLSFSHLESNGYRPQGESLKNFLTYKADFKINDKESIGVFLSHNASHEGVTGQIPYYDYYAGTDNGNAAYAKKNARLDYLTTRFAVSNTAKFNKHLSNNSTVFYSNSEIESVSAGAFTTTSTPNYGLRSVFTINTGNKDKVENILNLGTELQQCQSLSSGFRFTGTNDNLPLQVTAIADGQYLKLITSQQSYFIHDRINIKPIDFSVILGLSANSIRYQRKDLLALPGLITGNTADISFDKKFTTVFNPHLALQKAYKEQIFNLSYSEGYNAPTAANGYIAAINKVNDDLVPERGKMIDFSVQGLLFKTRLDYQVSLFNIDISNKLTTLTALSPANTLYTYTANTGNQRNQGLEASLGYVYDGNENSFIKKVTPFINFSYYDFKYTDFKTRLAGVITDFSDMRVVGTPKAKYSIGCDIVTKSNVYLNTTYNYLSDVYTDFANTNNVAGFGLLNAKLGYKITSKNKKYELEIFEAGNNLTNQINYTFLFLGNNINDADAGNGYPPGVKTDINPGPAKAYYWTGVNFKYHL
jgi:iron complex outermembrane recepter protein